MPDFSSQNPLQKLDRAPLSKRLAELSGRTVQAPANIVEATSRLQARPPTSQKRVVYAAIDVSTSMQGVPLTQAKRGFVDFAKRVIGSGFEVGLVSFGDDAEEISYATRDLDRLTHAAERLTTKGSTNMAAGIDLAAACLGSSQTERVIFLVTDGAPNVKEQTLISAARAKQSGIQIITLGTEGADQEFLKLVASREALSQTTTTATLQIAMGSSAKLLLGP